MYKRQILGFPTLISIPGIIEGPAKPKEFYTLRDALGENVAREKLGGKFLVYDDPRLTEVAKGYVMQAIFYHVFGNPFCENKRCRLYNARWQEELLEAQLSSPEFCPKHARRLKELRTNQVL